MKYLALLPAIAASVTIATALTKVWLWWVRKDRKKWAAPENGSPEKGGG